MLESVCWGKAQEEKVVKKYGGPVCNRS